MTTISEVLQMLIPDGGYVVTGNSYESIVFLEAEPITKQEFEAGFADFETFRANQLIEKTTAKTALLAKLGITDEEAKLLLS
jgi:hypothetical protein